MKIEWSSGQRRSGAMKAAGARRCVPFDLRAPRCAAVAFGAIATFTVGGAFAQDNDPSHADAEPAPQAAPATPAPAAPAPAARPAPGSYETPPDDSGSGLG